MHLFKCKYKGEKSNEKTLETLWNDYLAGECAIIDTEEEW